MRSGDARAEDADDLAAQFADDALLVQVAEVIDEDEAGGAGGPDLFRALSPEVDPDVLADAVATPLGAEGLERMALGAAAKGRGASGAGAAEARAGTACIGCATGCSGSARLTSASSSSMRWSLPRAMCSSALPSSRIARMGSRWPSAGPFCR